MKHKKRALFFAILTVLLLLAASAAVVYNYRQMQLAILYHGASAPASIAFLVILPFLPFIVASAILTFVFYKKSKSQK